jgi:signal transduction histidine kinase
VSAVPFPAQGSGRRRALPRGVRLVVGVALTVLALGGAIVQLRTWGLPGPLAAGLGLVQTVPVLLVGRTPLGAWRLVALGLAVSTLLGYGQGQLGWPWPATSCIVLLVVLYAVASRCERGVVVAVGVLTGLLVMLPAWWTVGLPPGVVVGALAAVAGVLVVGDNVRIRRQVLQELQQELAHAAVLAERSRIARELHDVVAHHLSLIAVQAEAAPHRIAGLSVPARETFTAIRGAARAALAELAHLVGVLRDEAEPAERHPQPGLDRVTDLLAGARQAGVPVDLRIVGASRPLTPGVDLSAYRIVQEALSNVTRHAPGSSAVIELCYEPEALRVRVANTAPRPDPAGRPAGSVGEVPGHGLVGIRERVAMLHGAMRVGSLPDGGFQIEAMLPTTRPGPDWERRP